jgi:hypothetical protein
MGAQPKFQWISARPKGCLTLLTAAALAETMDEVKRHPGDPNGFERVARLELFARLF